MATVTEGFVLVVRGDIGKDIKALMEEIKARVGSEFDLEDRTINSVEISPITRRDKVTVSREAGPLEWTDDMLRDSECDVTPYVSKQIT